MDSHAAVFQSGPLNSDTAIGGLHTVCAVGFGLTSADNAFLEWRIVATELNPSTSNLLELGGDDLDVAVGDIPCVQWRSAGVGDQTIEALYDPDGDGPEPSDVLLWDGVFGQGGSQPLIQEWNSIDVTRLVAATGTVQGSVANDGTSEVTNLTAVPGTPALCVRSRDAFVGDEDCSSRPDLNGKTLAAGGPVSKGKLGTTSLSFIDYTFGSHTAHYNGPVGGAEQVYTFEGCGSIRLEDPVTGASHLLTSANRSATVLTSNYGVAFTVFSTADGTDLASDGSNASCKVGNRTRVLIITRQDVQLTSFLDTAPDETVTVRWERTR